MCSAGRSISRRIKDHSGRPRARTAIHASISDCSRASTPRKDSRIGKIARYGKAGFEQHQQKEGTVLTVQFELAGQTFTALNGGPIFKFNEAVSLQIYVEDQKELDY